MGTLDSDLPMHVAARAVDVARHLSLNDVRVQAIVDVLTRLFLEDAVRPLEVLGAVPLAAERAQLERVRRERDKSGG